MSLESLIEDRITDFLNSEGIDNRLEEEDRLIAQRCMNYHPETTEGRGKNIRELLEEAGE